MYKESLVVFLDIMGFSDAILETETNQGDIKTMAKMLIEVKRGADTINRKAKKAWKTDFSAHAFSDSIVVSCPVISQQSFIFMAHLIAALQMVVMQHGFLLRGAVSSGGHYERIGVCFGPAFVRAYQMEKQAQWSRVIIDPLVLQKLGPNTVRVALESYLLRDNDGLCYFNYLHLTQVARVLQLQKKPGMARVTPDILVGNYKQHKEYLLAMIETTKAKGRLSLLPRYHAVADYHNQYLKEIYEHLPLTEDYREIDPKTATGEIIEIFKNIASSQQGVTDSYIESYLQAYVKLLCKARDLIQACEIDLASIFGPLYPDISVPPRE